MAMKKRSHFPAFGSWDYCDEHSFTQYLESAMPASFAAGEDADRRHSHHQMIKKAQQKKQGKVCDIGRTQATPKSSSGSRKAVDEDLYQIPPELLDNKPKRQKGLLRMMLSGLNCICIA